MFCWQCISIHPCNENQLHALFILSLFRQSTSTCFGHICSPSSGGILCVYVCVCMYVCIYVYIYTHTHTHTYLQLVRVVLFKLTICCTSSVGTQFHPSSDNSTMMGYKIFPKHVEIDWRNELRVNSASSWFSLHGCIYI